MASRSQTGRPPPRAAQGGLGYVVVLFWLALGSLALAGEAMLWSMDRQRAPLKRSGFAILDLEFEHRQRYADWQFIHHSARTLYLPPVMLRPAAPPASAP